MAETVSSHQVAAFSTPINGGSLDANVVRGNDNTLRVGYVAHDADPGIHLQSSALASRPAAGSAGRKWLSADTGSYRLFYDTGAAWQELTYLRTDAGGTVTGNVVITGSLTVDTTTLFVDSSNNRVGVGTVTPAVPLDVTGVFNGAQARFGNTAGRGLEIETAANGGTNEGLSILNALGAGVGTLVLQTEGVEWARLDENGFFGLGGTPVYRLDVIGQAGTENIARIGQTAVSNGYVITSDGSALTHTWATAGSALLTLTGSAFTLDVPLVANGNVTLGNASGDTLTVAPNAVTWSNNPTHSGNHTFSGNVTVQGTFTLDPSGGASSVEPVTSQNVNTATTIFSRGAASFGVVIVTGFSGSDSFTDIVALRSATATAITSATVSGSPAARTYTVSSNNLQLAMASGTYAVAARGFALS